MSAACAEQTRLRSCDAVGASCSPDAGLDSEATGDIRRYTWRKTILNAALSPISALLDMTMAQVMDCGDTLRTVEALLEGEHRRGPGGRL